MAGLGVGMGVPPAMRGEPNSDSKALLNTYIHNYFVNEGHMELAKAIRNSKLPTRQDKLKKESQGTKANGIDDSLDGDSKDDAKNRLGADSLGDAFLLDYWFIFWDMWSASKNKDNKADGLSAQYLMQNQMRQQPIFSQNIMARNMNPGFQLMHNNGQQMNLQKNAMANNARNMNPPPFARMPQMNQQHPMQRDGSDMDVNQQRPQSPGSAGENAPSPKRRRVDDSFNGGQMGPRGPIGGQLPNVAVGNHEAMIQQNGKMNSMSPAELERLMGSQKNNSHLMYSQTLANQTRSAMSNVHNGFNPSGPHMSPTMNSDGQFDNGSRGASGTSNGGALADYQMQLMLLEQQNKKRLMMARQEHEVHHGSTSANMLGGQPGYSNNTSPHGRNGQSPNTNDTKRNTPKMGQGSPLPDGTMPPNRGSPAPPNFDAGSMSNMQMNQPFMPQMTKLMNEGALTASMRPPGSHMMNPLQAEMISRSSGRPPNGNWQGGPMQGPMMGQGPGAQQNQPDGSTNQQGRGGKMAPPQAPATSKAQTSPTQQNAAPPTPSQGGKPSTKKKDTKDTKKKSNKKSGPSTNVASNNPEADRVPTPTPQTPATPVNPESTIIKGHPVQNQAHQAHNDTMQQPNNIGHMPANVGTMVGGGPFGEPSEFDNFSFIDNGPMPGEDAHDILGGFDFDTFLGDPSGMNWDGDFMTGDGLETGAGQ